MKKLMLMILFLSLTVAMIFANNPQDFQNESENEYGIDPNESYPGNLVIEILKAAEDEAVIVVEDAYSTGYKDGRIDGAAIWKPKYSEQFDRAEKYESRPTIFQLILSVAGGVVVGSIGSAIFFTVGQ